MGTDVGLTWSQLAKDACRLPPQGCHPADRRVRLGQHQGQSQSRGDDMSQCISPQRLRGGGKSPQPSWCWAKESRCSRGWTLPRQGEPAPCPPMPAEPWQGRHAWRQERYSWVGDDARVLEPLAQWGCCFSLEQDCRSYGDRGRAALRTTYGQQRICIAGVCSVNPCLTW